MAKILIVDDSPTSRMFLKFVLNESDHEVIEAGDGAAALELLSQERPDLVISDILMPTMDGFEFVHKLRGNPDFSTLPVIFRTASYLEGEAAGLAEACGVTHIITDPRSPELIVEKVEDALSHRRTFTAGASSQQFRRDHARLLGNKLVDSHEQLKRRTDRLTAVIDANIELASERDPKILLQLFCHIARDLVAARYALVAGVEDDAGTPTRHVCLSGFYESAAAAVKDACRTQDELIDQALQSGILRNLNPLGRPETVGLPSAHPPVHSVLAMPIRSMTRVHGRIFLSEKVGLAEFTEEDERVVTALAAQVGRLYEINRLYAKLGKSEKTLRKQQQDLRLLGQAFEQSGEAVAFMDSERRFFLVNPAFTRLTGYTLAEIRDRTAEESGLASTTGISASEEIDAKLLRDGHWQGESVARRKDGTEFPQWMSRSVIRDADGNVTNILTTFTDISEQKQRERELRESRERLRLFAGGFENSAASIVIVGPDQRILAANAAFLAASGYSAEEVIGQRNSFLLPDSTPESVRDVFRAELARTGRWQGELMGRRKDGSLYPRLVSIARVLDKEGKWLYSITSSIDITALKKAEQQLSEQQQTLRLLGEAFAQSGEAISLLDSAQRFVLVNPAFTELTGFTLEEIKNKRPQEVGLSIPAGARIREEAIKKLLKDGHWQGESVTRRKDGTEFPQWMSRSLIRDAEGNISYFLTSFSDISERKRAEEQIHRLAYHDSLTGLPNRLNLFGRVEQALTSARRDGERVALLSLDLDRFKNVNDTLGHAVGDGLLREVADRLSGCVRESDIVARLGGDEFVVVLTAIKSIDSAVRQAEKILAASGQTYLVDGHELNTTPSIGIAVFPEDGSSGDELVKHADVAMYHAKAEGRNNFQFFTSAMNRTVADRAMLEQGLRQALARNEFELYYQPQIRASSGRVIGFEALVRWHHPVQGMISPARFIPVAEDTGLIRELGEWVLREALRQLRAWQDRDAGGIRIAVNVSAQQLRSPDFPAVVADALSASGVEAQYLELEITESAAMQHPEETIKLLHKIRALNIDLAIDDFGTGYSSLNYLKMLPIQRLKVDQSFVRGIGIDRNDAAICSATIALAHALGLETIAEGVETKEQLAFLKKMKADFIQGYLFSKPLPADEARAFLDSQRTALPDRKIRSPAPDTRKTETTANGKGA